MSHVANCDVAERRRFELLAALLDHDESPWPAGELPPLGHWLLFPPTARQSAMGIDGHPARMRGSGLPEEDLPRRMWAGSRVRFLAPIPLGAEVIRETERLDAVEKTGRAGRMVFVTLRHRIRAAGELAIEEEQDIVYREAAVPGSDARPGPPSAIAAMPEASLRLQVDPVQLFRFSALTFNAHRIHYDRDYAMREEGYPALVVHGPFLATLLMDFHLRRHPGRPVAAFSYRALRPIFDVDPFTIGASPSMSGEALAAIDAAGGLAVSAEVISL